MNYREHRAARYVRPTRLLASLLLTAALTGCGGSNTHVSAMHPGSSALGPPGQDHGGSIVVRHDVLDPDIGDLSISTFAAVGPLTALDDGLRVVTLMATADLHGVTLQQSHAFLALPADGHGPVRLGFSNLDTALARMSAELTLLGEVVTTEADPPLPPFAIVLHPASGLTWGGITSEEQLRVSVSE